MEQNFICPTCHGRGKCIVCRGSSKLGDNSCQICNGTGKCPRCKGRKKRTGFIFERS